MHYVGTCRQKEVEMEAFQLQAQEVERYIAW